MSTRDTPPPASAGRKGLLKRVDQAAVATVLAVSLAALAVYWLVQGGWPLGRMGRRLIEIERAPRRSARYLVDINRADWPRLTQLPGVGEGLAKRIVASRDREGPFASHEELERVDGIGPRTLEAIRPYLRPIAQHRGE